MPKLDSKTQSILSKHNRLAFTPFQPNVPMLVTLAFILPTIPTLVNGCLFFPPSRVLPLIMIMPTACVLAPSEKTFVILAIIVMTL